MGQGSSTETPHLTLEQLSHVLAQRFAQKCYSPLELYCFTSVFRSLADNESGIRYWSEATLCRFLELPDALGVGSVLFHMASYLGAFPFPSNSPAILTDEALLKVVTILTERYGAVIKKGGRELWFRELYRSLAVYDRGVHLTIEEQQKLEGSDKKVVQDVASGNKGFAVDAPEEDEGEDREEDDDELVLAALDSMDAIDVFKHGEHTNLHHSIIPADNLLKLVELLLLIAPIDPQESLSSFATNLSDGRIRELRKVANVIISSFGVENKPGINYRTFKAVVSTTLPYLFDGLNPLFEHFLFAKDFDLSKRKPNAATPAETHPIVSPPKTVTNPEPLLQDPGEILDLTILSQLSFFIKGNNLFRRLRPLYSGSQHGFSMGSFERLVFKWRAPSILLVSGTLLSPAPTTARERTLSDMLPPNRLPHSLSSHPYKEHHSTTFTFGAYIPGPWKHTHRQCFGDSNTLLFQLAPVHDVFPASTFNSDYVSFNKPPTHPAGISFGTSIPHQTSAHNIHQGPTISVGPVSLHLDDSLEFGIFTHLSEGGGSFQTSCLPGRKGMNWQDRFEIESLEVWGCGGDEEAELQRKEWAWEEREAEMRRRVNLGTGDIDADRELLMMAGLIGGGRSGGSV